MYEHDLSQETSLVPVPKRRYSPVLIGALTLLILVIGTAYWQIDSTLDQKEDSTDEKITILQKQIAALEEEIQKVSGQNTQIALSLPEIQKRQEIREKSQEELVTGAVSKVSPSVVSVVVTKEVPKLEIVYQNPFGDDPFFKDFGFQIPTYRQRGTEERKIGAGTGFVVDSRGYILTNKHVVDDMSASYTVLLSDGSQQVATVVYRDPKNDIALLKINKAGLTAIPLGNSDNLKLGQTVIAIGNALGEYNNSVSIGIVSGLNRDIRAANGNQIEDLQNVIQTDAAINPGNSGGPLINTNGEALGINVATVAGSSNISFAIPINEAKKILKTVLN